MKEKAFYPSLIGLASVIKTSMSMASSSRRLIDSSISFVCVSMVLLSRICLISTSSSPFKIRNRKKSTIIRICSRVLSWSFIYLNRFTGRKLLRFFTLWSMRNCALIYRGCLFRRISHFHLHIHQVRVLPIPLEVILCSMMRSITFKKIKRFLFWSRLVLFNLLKRNIFRGVLLINRGFLKCDGGCEEVLLLFLRRIFFEWDIFMKSKAVKYGRNQRTAMRNQTRFSC